MTELGKENFSHQELVALENRLHKRKLLLCEIINEKEEKNADQEIELFQVEAALLRIQKGAYHLCCSCGTFISISRLTKHPYTTLCSDCAV